jgi:DNA invertase Pin-like site-specific DNA recombinase
VHCLAHREALAAGDAARSFLDFQMLDRFANKVYEWVGRSTNRRNELKRLLKDVFEEDYVVVLQIHTVR